jgi:hypothetical protein
MWAVCGPPRTGTTAMLEAVASWTSLSVRWSVRTEWANRRQTGLNEAFLELPPDAIRGAGPDDVVKILNPGVPVEPTRAILMVRDPEVVSASARARLGQLISPAEVVARADLFRARGWPLDEVDVSELCDLPSLFGRLASRGWPVVGPSRTLSTKAVR